MKKDKIVQDTDKMVKDTLKKGRGFLGEFKDFIMRGNVMDMAVGVIIGGAFTAIVTSLSEDILKPILGIFGGKDFSYLKLTIGSGKEAPVLAYGNFLTAIVHFLITAGVIFILVKGMNALNDRLSKKVEEVTAPTTKKCPYCCSEIPVEATRCAHCTSEISE